MQQKRRKPLPAKEHAIFRELFLDYSKWQRHLLSASNAHNQNHQPYCRGMHAVRMTQIIRRQETQEEDNWINEQSHLDSEKYLRKTGAFKRLMLSQVKPQTTSFQQLPELMKTCGFKGGQTAKIHRPDKLDGKFKEDETAASTLERSSKIKQRLQRPTWRVHLHKNHWKEPFTRGPQYHRHQSQDKHCFFGFTSKTQEGHNWGISTLRTQGECSPRQARLFKLRS